MFGIMLISFLVIQFRLGGPVERMIAQLTGTDAAMTSREQRLGRRRPRRQRQQQIWARAPGTPPRNTAARRGLDPEFIKSLEKQFCFDKPAYERFFLMMKNLPDVRFRQELLPRRLGAELIKEKLPVSVSLGIWMTLLTYLISIPLGIRKAVRDGELFDTLTSGALVIGYAVLGFLVAGAAAHRVRRKLVLPVVPPARPDVRELERAVAPRQGRRLLLAPDAADHRNGARRLHDDDVPHQEHLPRRDPQAVRHDGARRGPQ